jgi:hypothetical protein
MSKKSAHQRVAQWQLAANKTFLGYEKFPKTWRIANRRAAIVAGIAR